MALVDANILSRLNTEGVTPAIQRGLSMAQAYQQNQEAADQAAEQDKNRVRSEQAKQAFQKAAQGQDITTPEGMKTAITGLAQAGFADEAAKVYEAHKELFQRTPNSYSFDDTPGGRVSQNQQTGEVKLIPNIPSEKQSTKQAEDKFDSMKGTLDKFMTPPAKGWDPLKGEKANALSAAIRYMPSDVLKTKVAQDWIGNNSKEQQNAFINPLMGQAMMLRPEMSAENRISSENQKQTGDYEVAKRGAVAFKADYDNYKKALASGDKQAIKIAQQGMVDKYITTSTGKSTGDAQFKNFIDGQGVTNAMQNLGDKLMNGSMAPQKIFDAMNDITMSTAMKMNEKTKQANAMTRTQVQKENKAHGFGIDAESLITHPENMLTQDSTAFAQPTAGKAVKISTKAEFDKLPSGTTYIGPSGHTAVKP